MQMRTKEMLFLILLSSLTLVNWVCRQHDANYAEDAG